jgi:hypothetical protein
MKSRDLFTTPNLIASNYTITKLEDGKYLHRFTPQSTPKVYEFEANATPVIEEGERYNIGYIVDANGRNIVEVSTLSKASLVNPMFSFMAAKNLAQETYAAEKAKNEQRVSYSADDAYYWGKKYAWRMFGTAIPKNAFFEYLKEINHPSVPCITSDPDLPYGNESIAYKEEGLQEAVMNLIASAVKVSSSYYQSPLYSKKFSIKGINAITDKK